MIDPTLIPTVAHDTKAIPQPNSTFLYSRALNRFDVFNAEAIIFLDFIDGERCIRDIADAVIAMFPEAPADLITTDCDSFLEFLTRRGYFHLSPHARRIDQSLFELEALSREVKAVFADIEITRNCNLRCSYCYANATQRMDELPNEQWRAILLRMKDSGLRAVKISGGEPLLYCDISELLPWVSDNFITSLNTNGWFLDNETAAWLGTLGLQEVQVSLDSVDPDIHDRMRGAGSWHMAMTAIKNIRTVGIPLRISATIGCDNVDMIPALKELADSFAADLNIEIMKPVGRGETLPSDAYARDLCVFDETKNGLLDYLEVRCQAQLGLVAISSDGMLKPCNLTKTFFRKRKADVISPIDSAFIYEDTRTFRYTNDKCEELDMARLRYADSNKCIFS